MSCGNNNHHSHHSSSSSSCSHNEANLQCGCEAAVPACPQPHYVATECCEEDSKRTVYEILKSQVFKNASSFAMPACDTAIWVSFPGITDVAVGAYLWAYGFGYLLITQYNALTQQIELKNTCQEACGSQAAPGTVVPQCTAFVVTPPPCSADVVMGGSSSLYPYLNAGFTAPANGLCIAITVTNVNGLSVGKNVSLNGGEYRISAITTPTNITICNDGDGLTPGVVVDYKDPSGNLVVPVVLIDANPCLNTPVAAGKMLVCHSNVISPLGGILDNQIPVFDLASGEVNFRTLGIPVLDCTQLSICLTLDPANPLGTSYLITVVDTSAFLAHDIISIGGTVFEVDSVDDGIHMHVTPVDVVTAIQNYPVGSAVCSADCCTQLDVRVTALEALALGVASVHSAVDTTPFDVVAVGSTTNTSPEASISVANNLTVPVNFLIRPRGWAVVGCHHGDAVGDVARITADLQLGYGLAATPAYASANLMQKYLEYYTGKGVLSGNAYDSINLAPLASYVLAVPAGSTLYARAKIIFTLTDYSHADVTVGVYGETNIEVIPFLS